MKSITEKYAQYITNLDYSMVPSEVIIAAKTCILDSVGNMISGCYSTMGAKAVKYVIHYPKVVGERCLVIGPGGEIYNTEDAVFIATIMARCADLDDGHRVAMGHPGSIIIPSVLIYGQQQKCTNKELLTAIVAGYEVYIRVGSSINPTSYVERGFDSTGVTGAVGCTAAIGKLYKLNVEQMKNALGLAALFATGLIEYQNDGSMGKVLCGVWAIDTASKAVRLAQMGFTGAKYALEGKKGFMQAFSNNPNLDRALEGLGEKYKINSVYFKMYACMRGLHASVDAILDIREKNTIAVEDIDKIEVHTTPFVERLSKPHPDTLIAAQSSVEFALAVALINGNIANEKILEEAMSQKKYYDLAAKVQIIIDADIQEYVEKNPSHWGAVKLVVFMKDGKCIEQWNPLPRGEAENPFSWEQLCDKVANMTAGTPYEQYSAKLCDAIKKFENTENVEPIFVPWNA